MALFIFARPEDDVVLKRLESPVIPPLAEGDGEEEINAKDWIIRRALKERVGNFNQEEERERNQGD